MFSIRKAFEFLKVLFLIFGHLIFAKFYVDESNFKKYDELKTKLNGVLGSDIRQTISDEMKNRAELIIAKQRHGPTGKVDLYFDGMYTRFADLDTQHTDSY